MNINEKEMFVTSEILETVRMVHDFSSMTQDEVLHHLLAYEYLLQIVEEVLDSVKGSWKTYQETGDTKGMIFDCINIQDSIQEFYEYYHKTGEKVRLATDEEITQYKKELAKLLLKNID